MSTQGEKLTLLTNVSATGPGAAKGAIIGGSYAFAVSGTFGGATVTLQLLAPDNATFVDVPGTALAAAGFVPVILPEGASVRANVVGGAPAGLFATVARVPRS